MPKGILASDGLEGVKVKRTALSRYDGVKGTFVLRGGRPIGELRELPFESIAYLLWNGSLPTEAERRKFTERIASRRVLDDTGMKVIRLLGPAANPMVVLRTVISALGGVWELKRPTVDDAIRLTATVPTIVAAQYRISLGLEPFLPRDHLGHAANFLYLLSGVEPSKEQIVCFESYLVVMADHGMNPSTFSACVTASAGSDLAAAVVSGIGTLMGPAHGGAVRAAFDLVRGVGRLEDAERRVLGLLDAGERLPGFGHREYRTYDPRARILADLCLTYNAEFCKIAAEIERVALRELAKRHPDRPNFTNVDFFAGGVLSAAGVPVETQLCCFAMARIVGWTAHVIEYLDDGGRLISPTSEWTGPK